VKEDQYQFRIGDIVREKDFITVGDGEQMTGIVLEIKHLTFEINAKIFHDRLTIMWLETGEKEEMPDVLVELVSSVITTKKH